MSCIFIFVWRSLGGFDMVDLGSEKKQNSLRHFSSPFTLQLNYHKPYDVYNQVLFSFVSLFQHVPKTLFAYLETCHHVIQFP